MAELWKIALLTILFWGFVNQHFALDQAKKFYAPLMLGGSIGTFLSGPLVSFCTSEVFSTSWSYSLNLMILALSCIGALTIWLFFYLGRFLTDPKQQQESEKKSPLSVWQSIQICFRSRYLSLLAWITIADYIAYTLGEVIFFDVLHQLYPDPRDYCNFMGNLSEWSAGLILVSSLIITPFVLNKCRWVVAALVTPVCLLATLSAFFFALWHPTLSQKLELLVFLGSLLFCIVRAAKYTLFDTSKELSFILLPPIEKMQGKLVVDGMCSRFGRGGASILSLGLIQISGGVLASSGIAGILALAIAASCTLATSKLGNLVETQVEGASLPKKNRV